MPEVVVVIHNVLIAEFALCNVGDVAFDAKQSLGLGLQVDVEFEYLFIIGFLTNLARRPGSFFSSSASARATCFSNSMC